jgi:membrane protease YdiL (CAAX protease family)
VGSETPPDAFARALRGFGPIGIAAVILIVPFSGLLGPLRAAVPLLWAWRSRTPLRDFGLVRPPNWPLTIVFGVVAGIVLKLVMKSVVMPLLGAPPVNAAFQALQGNTAMLPGILVAVTLGAGFGEELTYRGFLFERMRRLLGDSGRTRAISVGVTSLLFALVHLPEQGLPGGEQALIMGLVMGTLYARARQLWFPVIVHSTFDVAAVFIIYFGLETRLAHVFFP